MKHNWSGILGIFLIWQGMLAQPHTEQPPAWLEAIHSPLVQYGTSYPEGVADTYSVVGALRYRFSDDLQLQMRRFHNRFLTHEEMTTSFLLQWYVTEKGYFYGGIRSEYDTSQNVQTQEVLRMQLDIGVGYEIKPNVILELGYLPELGGSKGNFTKEDSQKQNSFMLRARF